MMTPTAMSMTLPRSANSLNSFSITDIPLASQGLAASEPLACHVWASSQTVAVRPGLRRLAACKRRFNWYLVGGALLLKGRATVSEQPGRDRYRWKTLLLTSFTLLLVFGTVFAAVVFARTLDEIGFLRFPLGFYLLAQGLLIGMVALAFWSTRMQERFDRRLNEGEDL
jgi:putative solute:sodium symporter small subunit